MVATALNLLLLTISSRFLYGPNHTNISRPVHAGLTDI